MRGVGPSINVHAFIDGIDVPNHLSSGGKIVGSFFRHFCFCIVAVIVFAPDLGRKCRRSLDEPHFIFRKWSQKVGGVWRKRFAPRSQLRHDEANVVRVRFAQAGLFRVIVQAAKDSCRDSVGFASRGHKLHDPPADQFRLEWSTVQIVHRGTLLFYPRHGIDLLIPG